MKLIGREFQAAPGTVLANTDPFVLNDGNQYTSPPSQHVRFATETGIVGHQIRTNSAEQPSLTPDPSAITKQLRRGGAFSQFSVADFTD